MLWECVFESATRKLHTTNWTQMYAALFRFNSSVAENQASFFFGLPFTVCTTVLWSVPWSPNKIHSSFCLEHNVDIDIVVGKCSFDMHCLQSVTRGTIWTRSHLQNTSTPLRPELGQQQSSLVRPDRTDDVWVLDSQLPQTRVIKGWLAVYKWLRREDLNNDILPDRIVIRSGLCALSENMWEDKGENLLFTPWVTIINMYLFTRPDGWRQ